MTRSVEQLIQHQNGLANRHRTLRRLKIWFRAAWASGKITELFWGTLVGFWLLFATISLFYSMRRETLLMRECMADGWKEYQCKFGVGAGRTGGGAR